MGVSYCEVIERMKIYGKLKNDSAVARVLGVTPQALSNYKKRDQMPSKLVLKFAGIYGLSVDHLIGGNGPAYRAEPCTENFSRQEFEYIGKLLTIFRSQGKSTITDALKQTIDALSQYSEPADEKNEGLEKDKTHHDGIPGGIAAVS